MTSAVYIILGITLLCAMAASGSEPDIKIPKFITIGPCEGENICSKHPEITTCKLDCIGLDENGQGYDCINHFYDDDGNIFYDCFM